MGGGSDSKEIRYAPYIEAHHQDFLSLISIKRDEVIDSSPYSSFTDVEVEAAFFGAGYVISSFPSLYDMFGKFMAGLDVDVLYSQILNETVDGTVVNNLISSEAEILEDDIIENTLPRFTTGMRDINSVISSSFIVGKALMETARTKAIGRFSSEVKYKLIPFASERWRIHLDWNKNVIATYAEVMKLYYSAKIDVDRHNYDMRVRNLLWPFTVMEYERAALGVLTGARKESVDGPSGAQKAIGGALSGAAAGAMTGTVPGAVVGGLIGLAAAYA